MNKLLIASDLHGSGYWCRKLAERIAAESPDKIILLGDLLYHGPRNDLPRDYAPKEVLALLNTFAHRILAVRGNCDAEVDQMVLDFPIMADYTTLLLPEGTLLCTHGHLFGDSRMPPLQPGATVLSGHTHLFLDETKDGCRFLNPGSVALAKEGRPNSYMMYEAGVFTLKAMDGTIIPLPKA